MLDIQIYSLRSFLELFAISTQITFFFLIATPEQAPNYWASWCLTVKDPLGFLGVGRDCVVLELGLDPGLAHTGKCSANEILNTWNAVKITALSSSSTNSLSLLLPVREVLVQRQLLTASKFSCFWALKPAQWHSTCRLRQDDCEFKTSLGTRPRPCHS